MPDPAFEVAFRSVDFSEPDASVFEFTPPIGATVTEHPASDATADGPSPEQKDALAAAAADLEEPTVVGEGWSAVMVADLGALAGQAEALATTGDDGTDSASTALALLEALPTTSGTWGTGRVLAGTLFSAVLTDDGRLAVGMVTPETLGTALAAR